MRKVLLSLLVLFVCVSVVSAQPTTFWSPTGGVDAPWTDTANWTTTDPALPDGGPHGNFKVVFNNAPSIPCYLDEARQVRMMVFGDGSDGGTLRIANGGELFAGEWTEGEDTFRSWTGIGYGNGFGTVIVEEGGSFRCGDHLWIALQSTAAGTLIIDGGYVYVQGMYGMGFDNDGKGGAGVTRVLDGMLDLNQFHGGGNSISPSSILDVHNGVVKINGDSRGILATQIGDGRVKAFATADFDKTTSPVVEYVSDENKTYITAVHPQNPAPMYKEVVSVGDVTLEWDNWDPNAAGDDVIVSVWYGTEPNKAEGTYVYALEDEDVTGQARSSVVVNIPDEGMYYWGVECLNNGIGLVHGGDVFTFQTTNDFAPEVNCGGNVVTWLNEAAAITTTVVDEGTPALSWSYEPADGSVMFDDASAQNPVVTFTTTGAYTLTLTADDGFNPAQSDSLTVNVYNDSCEAARVGMGVNSAVDVVVDCVIDLDDFRVLAEQWMRDYHMDAPVQLEPAVEADEE